MKKRRIEIAVISDVHLGAGNCHAEELLAYLSSIRPKTLILNGDIVDVRTIDTHYFPPAHFRVLKKVLGMAAEGTEVFYICGNHDEVLRRFNNYSLGNIHIRNKLVLEMDGKSHLVFHGDVFDLTGRYTRWVTRLGGTGHSLLLWVNRIANRCLTRLGRPRISMANRVKASTRPRGHINSYERAVTDFAIRKSFDHVVCGHIHHPGKRWVETDAGSALYLNSGDWVSNLTALEYNFKRWKLYRYDEDKLSPFFADEDLKQMDINDLISHIVDHSREQKSPAKEKEKPSE